MFTGCGQDPTHKPDPRCVYHQPFNYCLKRLAVCFIGSIKVSLLRYLKDARSIPVIGEEMKGVEALPDSTVFSVCNGAVYFADPSCGDSSMSLGSHIRYVVQVS